MYVKCVPLREKKKLSHVKHKMNDSAFKMLMIQVF